MALIELATVIAEDPAAGRRWAAEPLPLTGRLTAVLTARFAGLPGPARAALLLAAVADGPDLRAAAAAVSGPDARALAPAEQLGLIQVDRTGLRFSHPLVRSAIYHSAPFARRAAAHRHLAGALHGQPDRRAWHLAAAAREIGDRLFLSPRTVGSHLYRSYPKLGVASRHQLRDVIALTSTPTPAHQNTGSETLL